MSGRQIQQLGIKPDPHLGLLKMHFGSEQSLMLLAGFGRLMFKVDPVGLKGSLGDKSQEFKQTQCETFRKMTNLAYRGGRCVQGDAGHIAFYIEPHVSGITQQALVGDSTANALAKGGTT